jgi:hypothetical protein
MDCRLVVYPFGFLMEREGPEVVKKVQIDREIVFMISR